jgi:hypothetical protein
MLKTVEAVLETDGNVRLLEAVDVPRPSRALVTILEGSYRESVDEAALLSEARWLRIGAAKKRTRHGSTCSRRGSPRPLPLLGSLTNSAQACRRVG